MQEKNYFDLVINVLNNWYVKFAQFTPNLIVGLAVFVLFFLASSYLSRISVRVFQRFFPKNRNYETLVNLIGFFRFLIMLIATFIALEIMGLNGFFLKFLGSLGVAGIIAGVALKDIVSSMFSGMLVSVDKAFKEGDYVTINGISGTVDEIGFLTTKVITDDGKKVYIPNQLIFSAPFTNFTASSHRKIFIDLDIPNTEDLELAKAVLKNEIEKISYVDDSAGSEVLFLTQKYGVYNLQVRYTPKAGENIVKAKSETLLRLKQRLEKEGIKTFIPHTTI
ncbi:mechanosensitive ion channel family protein [Planobacterium oryzisoli]|uniref:Mechanosensitive ion channel family protein n=1 Tax=Planobacterium oryzisoli TaxID=2771435 RepID=A0A931E979_9FLAO|nr:mechanosensitive ion channel domain-containing protein [Planobacterium oryzisoli]MBF5026498.1 mechanosensitive ion channel family protein [Planobacterium oryzisoli]